MNQKDKVPRQSLGRSNSHVLARNASPIHFGLVDVLQEDSAGISGQVAFPSAVVTCTRGSSNTPPCSRSLCCHRRAQSLQPADHVLEEQIPHVVAACVVVPVVRNTSPWIFRAARRTSNGAAQPWAATWTSRGTDPCRWPCFASARCRRLRQAALRTTLGLRNTAHWSQREQQRNVGSAECSRQGQQ